MVNAKHHMGAVDQLALLLARNVCTNPLEVSRGDEVTTLGQMSVKFIPLHVSVLIEVSVLNVGTKHTV